MIDCVGLTLHIIIHFPQLLNKHSILKSVVWRQIQGPGVLHSWVQALLCHLKHFQEDTLSSPVSSSVKQRQQCLPFKGLWT